MNGNAHQFQFTVEEHDRANRAPFIVHAGANNVGVAWAAYEALRERMPDRLLMLRQASRAIERSDQTGR
jgi:hypothetical protein